MIPLASSATGLRVTRAHTIASWVLAGAGLLLVLFLHLLAALLAGLLVHELVHLLAPRLRIVRIRRRPAKLAVVALLAVVIVGILTGALVGIAIFVRSEAGSLPALLQRMADVIEGWRMRLPAAIVTQLPADVDSLREISVGWLRNHASTLGHAGQQAGRVLAHVGVGFVIGALIALHDFDSSGSLGPLGQALQARVARLTSVFHRVVFGQVRISAINATLTGLYLVIALPLSGIHVPLAKTMIIVTFFVGLLPVIGNLISNTIIVVLSLSVSATVAVVSLMYLVVIHKLEYFLNAQIIGTQVRAHAWELLVAMLIMESAFGISGLIAAPIYYAYLKDELTGQQLV
jgi:predicted PurR-regulated permease PerM